MNRRAFISALTLTPLLALGRNDRDSWEADLRPGRENLSREQAAKTRVYLDGKKVDCFAADRKRGCVAVACRDGVGNAVFVRSKPTDPEIHYPVDNGYLLLEILHGRVTIKVGV